MKKLNLGDLRSLITEKYHWKTTNATHGYGNRQSIGINIS